MTAGRMTAGRMTRRRADQGSATAEFALAFPAVLGVVALLLGGVQVAALQVRAQDAAADAARGLGRGDSPAAVAARLERQVPGAFLDTWADGDVRCVRVEVAPSGPAAVLGLRARADACALDDAR
jgi:Flp pilus assembly protein TadG